MAVARPPAPARDRPRAAAEARPLALPRLAPGRIELALDDAALIGDGETLLQDRDRLGRPPREPQRAAQVVEGVGVVEAPRLGQRVHGALQDRDRLLVAALVHQVEALLVEVGAARR